MKTRIGIIGHFSGRFTQAWVWYRQGIEAFLSLHGTRAGDVEVELVYRDIGGTDVAGIQRVAEELVSREGVALLGGFYLSGDALAAAPVSAATKTPAVLFNAASHTVLAQSPFFIRVGSSVWQFAVPAAEWAIRSGKKRAYLAVADNLPGRDIQEGFGTRFKALGGQLVGEDRMPPDTEDFSPFVERILQARPDVVQIFVATRISQVGLINALAARGVFDAGITVIGLGNETDLHLYDEAAIGCYSVNHYTPAFPSAESRTLQEAVSRRFPADAEPVSAFTVEAYDGMHLLYRMIESQAGKKFDGVTALDTVRGYSWNSPRGPARIEADTRDVTQNIHVRRLERIDGRRQNVIVETFAALKDPWAQMHR